MFRKRTEGAGIMFSGTHAPGQRVKLTIEDGDKVELRIGDELVLVEDIRKLDESRYKGVIYGFEQSLSVEINGLRLKEEIEFEEKNIFSCRGK